MSIYLRSGIVFYFEARLNSLKCLSSESLGVLGGILDLKNQTVHYSALLSGLSDLIPDILQISSSRILSFAKKEFAL